jgi:hypothetical protein
MGVGCRGRLCIWRAKKKEKEQCSVNHCVFVHVRVCEFACTLPRVEFEHKLFEWRRKRLPILGSGQSGTPIRLRFDSKERSVSKSLCRLLVTLYSLMGLNLVCSCLMLPLIGNRTYSMFLLEYGLIMCFLFSVPLSSSSVLFSTTSYLLQI